MTKQNNRSIVVSIDFTSIAEHAFKESIPLARKCNAEIRLIHIHTSKSSSREDIIDQFEALIKRHADLIGDDITVRYNIMPGSSGEVVDRLNDYCYMADPIYFVVGYELKSGLDRLTGTYILNIIHGCDYPIIAIKENETLHDMDTLLYPLLLNDYSMQKTQSTIDFVKHVNGKVELLALAVNHTGKDDTNLKVNLNHVKERFTGEDVPFNEEWLTGGKTPTDILLDYAHKKHADIVSVVFDNDPSFFQRMWGNRDEEVLTKTDIPLLIVKGKDWRVSSSFSATGGGA